MNQIEVLVKDKTTGDQRQLTYKSFLDLQDRFDLIGQCDENGNQIPGDPNLNPRHQKVQANDAVVPAGDGTSKMTMEEKLAMKAELLKKFEPKAEEVEKVEPPQEAEQSEPKQRKKPGPKPKVA